MGTKNTKTIVGNKFSNLTIIEADTSIYIEKSGKPRKKSIVRCDCGAEFEMNNNYLIRDPKAQCKKCRYNFNCIVHIGDVFDKLTVINFSSKKTNKTHTRKRAICKCECGNIISIRTDSLKNNKQNNCGCIPRWNETKVGNLNKTFFNRIKRNAKIRNIKFDITMEEIWEVYKNQNGKCALSGLDINFANRAYLPSTASLDRIDSLKPYIKTNIQWVHKDINKIKMEFSQEKFIELCKLVAKNN